MKSYNYAEYLETFLPRRIEHDWQLQKINGRMFHRCSRCGAVLERDKVACADAPTRARAIVEVIGEK